MSTGQQLAAQAQSPQCEVDIVRKSSDAEYSARIEDFLDLLLPADGLRVVALKLPTEQGMRHKYLTSNAATAGFIRSADQPSVQVYFGCATMREKGSRRAENAAAAKAFWLDLDCGPGKPYGAAAEAAGALKSFFATLGLPRPMVVSSGVGLHVYWPLTEALRPGEWKATATLLKEACSRQGLQADPSRTADIASILRPVGATHRKDGDKPVQLLRAGGPFEHGDIRSALEAYLGMQGVVPAARDGIGGLGPIPDHIKVLAVGANDDALIRPQPLDFEALRSAVLFMPAEGIASYPAWRDLTFELAWAATRYPERAGELLELLHEASSRPGAGNYSVDDTHRQWVSALARTATKIANGEDVRTTASIFDEARSQGWEPRPLSGTTSQLASLTSLHRLPTLTDLIGAATPYRRRTEHGDLLNIGEITVLNAPGGVGKTTYLVGVTLSLASGVSLIGQTVIRRRKVLFVSLEEQREEIGLKFRAALIHHGRRVHLPADVGEWIIPMGAGEEPGLTLTRSSGRGEELNLNGFQLLDDLIVKAEAEVVILDPVMMLFPVGMNDNGLVYSGMAKLKDLAARRDCAVLLAAHTKKGGAHGADGVDGAEAIMGAGALSNAARVVKGLKRLTPDECAAVGVPYGQEAYIRQVVDQKANFTPPGAAQYIELVSERLNNAMPPDYPDGDYVAVATDFQPQLGARSVPLQALKDVMVVLARGAQGGAQGGAPFSPSKAGTKAQSRYFAADVARAIAPHFPVARPGQLEQAAKDAIKDLCDRGWAEISDQKVGSNMRKGITVKWSVSPWAQEPQPAGAYVI